MEGVVADGQTATTRKALSFPLQKAKLIKSSRRSNSQFIWTIVSQIRTTAWSQQAPSSLSVRSWCRQPVVVNLQKISDDFPESPTSAILLLPRRDYDISQAVVGLLTSGPSTYLSTSRVNGSVFYYLE